MTSRRGEGRARILPTAPGKRWIPLLIFWMLLLVAAIASIVGRLPDWVALAAWLVAIIYNGVGRMSELVAGCRELRAAIPRVDPDYRRPR